jgi:Flp pilus assembly protein TadG
MKHHAQRGQVIPFWAVSIASMLALTGGILTYGNAIAWQIRAQNAADAAALGAIGVQTQQLNTMNMLLYSAAVEEFRIRYLLNGAILAMHKSGGCMPKANGPPANDCIQEFQGEAERFVPAVNRYSNTVNMLNGVTQSMSVANQETDMTNYVAALQNTCGTVTGGDCAFKYLITKDATRASLYNVDADAYGILQPNKLRTSAATYQATLYGPIEIEIAVCAKSPSPLLWHFGMPTGHVIARSAAEAVIVVQDWMQPGEIVDPNSGQNETYFQDRSQETNWYTSTFTSGLGAGTYYDWYTPTFGGNANTPSSSTMRFSSTLSSNEFSARVGWWDAIPIKPWSGALSSAQVSSICT